MLAKLERPVLILNKHWNAIGTAPVFKAINLLLSKYNDGNYKAHVIDDSCAPHTWDEWSKIKEDCKENKIFTAHASYKIPEVVRLTRYDKMPRDIITFSRLNIFKRDNNTCQYCNKRPGSEELTIDHVIPKSRGGKTTWENCVLACVTCNSIKGSFLLHEVKNSKFPHGMKLLRKPIRPKFKDFAFMHVSQSWKQWLNECYWSIELENENG
jgi:5-methylcytosine-specific restriction endonuclease McrA